MQSSKRIHFIGVGGIGISALARWAIHDGKKVSGSDQFDSALIQELIVEGAMISLGHKPDYLDRETDLVIYTEAINKNSNPEYLEAKSRNIKTLSYFEALGELSKIKKTIAIAGTHGKTTTTAMLGQALIEAGLDPTIIVGSKVKAFDGKNIYFGKSDWLVAEACEYRRSFLNLKPFGLILLNCEVDHLDYYKGIEDYLSAYRELAKKIPSNGFIIFNDEDPHLKVITKGLSAKLIPVSKEEIHELKLKVPGRFNQLNALHALKVANAIDLNKEDIKRGLKKFEGTWRRMEHKGEFKGAIIIDDYGHHPTEIKVTLEAIKEKYPEKELICVFQPHQYSRTHLLANEFSIAFKDADQVLITDIYEARDTKEDKQKINAEKLAEMINHHTKAEWSGNLDETFDKLSESANNNQVVVIMGAGSIGSLAERLINSN